LLARREHSLKELRAKLKAKGIAPELIDTVTTRLANEGLQSDQRFTESYLHSRIQKGYGPSRLEQELYERGIDEQLVQSCLENLALDWMEILASVRSKKFRQALPVGYSEQARESRFLQYRGFTTEQIRHFYKNKKNDDE
jgi:regulatory protein